MIGKWLLPLLAIAGVSYCAYAVVQMRKVERKQTQLQAPVMRPNADGTASGKYVAGSGLVEAREENIPVGAPMPGIVQEVFVKVGQRVKPGDPLFRLDDREIKGQALVADAQLKAAEAQHQRLKRSPRAEDLPPLKAAVTESEARAQDTKAALERSARLFERKMISDSDYDRDRYAHRAALASVERSRADLKRIEAGAWSEDLKIAEAEIARTRAQLEKTQLDLDRLTVRALAEGEVLKVDVRPGQLATTVWNTPMVVLGNLDELRIRVDVDEHDLGAFQPDCNATASPRGRPSDSFELSFVRVEPYVIPKRQLTGDNAERVDTRVLQVIYAVRPREGASLYVGQQMDVFIESPEELPSRSESAKAP